MGSDDLLITDREKIRKEWRKSESDVFKDVNIIKDWFKTQKHLPEIPTDNMIEFFLTNCKYSIEKTKQNLDMYYTSRKIMPDFFEGVNPCEPEDMKSVYAAGYWIPLPKLTPSLHRIFLIKYAKDVDTEKTDIRKICTHILTNIYEVRIHEDLVMGDIYICDYEHIKLGLIAKLTPIVMKQISHILEKVQSNRLKELHILFPPPFIDTVIKFFKQFLPKKLGERIFLHKELEDLLKYVPQEILPSDYGGQEKSAAELQELWKQKMYEYKDRFVKLHEMRIDESLRPEKLENDEILGYHGNFKKISLD